MGRKKHRTAQERARPEKRASRSRTPSGPEERAPTDLPLWKKILFSLLATALFFGAAELALALLGIERDLYDDDPYVGSSSALPHFVPGTSADGASVFETADNKLRLFHRQQFARVKADGTYRVFCLGGSTTYGRPYGDQTSFCGWLRELLRAAAPSRDWEVINAGGVSYASYRVALLMEELLARAPDLFIVYTGHNEFLERRTYGNVLATPRAVRGLGAIASRTHLWSGMRRAADKLRGRPPETPSSTLLDDEVRTLLDGSVGPDAYRRDDDLREQVLEHFSHSLARMSDMARSVGAETLFVTPAANLRHASPFKSAPADGLDSASAERWQALFDKATEAFAGGRAEEASRAIEEALAIDARHAHLHYLNGQVLDALGRFPEARSAYERARDEDVCPLRALDPLAEIVEQVAAERDLPRVDFRQLVDELAPEGIPGEETFLDHVHPTIDGNRRLALAIFEELTRRGIVRPPSGWNEDAIHRVTETVENRLDPKTHGIALSNLSRVLGWAGKLEEARKLALQATELAPRVATVQHQAALCAHLTEDLEQAVTHYRATLALDPSMVTAHSNLAVILDEADQDVEAAVHYRQAIALLSDKNAAYRERLREALAKLEG